MKFFRNRHLWLILLAVTHASLLWYFYYLPFVDSALGKAPPPSSGGLWLVSIAPCLILMANFNHLPSWVYSSFSIAIWLFFYWALIYIIFRLTHHSSGTR